VMTDTREEKRSSCKIFCSIIPKVSLKAEAMVDQNKVTTRAYTYALGTILKKFLLELLTFFPLIKIILNNFFMIKNYRRG